MSLQIAIVGSGPAGCFMAELLSRKIDDCQIDIIERLPSLFGLVRAGVAPDHQGTKNVTRQFERTLEKPNIRVLANLTVGKDISYETLKQFYDLIIFATGASRDRTLDIAGEELSGIYGSSHFVGWYNGHPDSHQPPPTLLGPSVAIIGHGNVALDIARLLAKTPEEKVNTDICQSAMEAINQSDIRDIFLIGRGSPEQAKFTPPELAELKDLSNAIPLIESCDIPESPSADLEQREARAKQMNLDLFREFTQNVTPDLSEKTRIHFLFNLSPLSIQGVGGKVSCLNLKQTSPGKSEKNLSVPVNTLISAIGYRSDPITGVPFDDSNGRLIHESGLVENGVYVTGWCRRGPTGVIPTNRADALEISKRILNDLDNGVIPSGKPGRKAMDQFIKDHQLQVLSYADWKIIDNAEQSAAQGEKPREKFISTADMISLVR
ncbi:FAD-dependent oxidoreductase [Oceanospirillum sp.]|uniref:FAD-dependent oxidoreductase n=1 Tax=Oceanospirillum sp. TaxID=2021254 RepID=UPI003A8DC291